MGYLVLNDYDLPIQQKQLGQITTSDTKVRIRAEALAQEKLTSKLTQRYDTSREFADTEPYDFTKTYQVDDLVIIDFPAYDSTLVYPINALIVYNGNGYISNTAITVPEAFNPAHWTLLGAQYDMYYVSTPYQEFNYKNYYKPGDIVYRLGSVYTCLIETRIPDHFTQIQYTSVSQIPYINIFPEDPNNGVTYWGVGVPYSVAAGVLPTDTTKWTKGDNRCQQIVWYMAIIALYYISNRGSVNQVPANRLKAYEEAIQWLDDAANGVININMPEKQPDSGYPVMWGGNPKRINQW